MNKSIFSFGEILWDIFPTATILGGAPFNLAARSNMLGEMGIMISRLGRDELGETAYQKVIDLGMNTDYLQWDEIYPTGTVDITIKEKSIPSYKIITNVAYDFIEMAPNLQESLEKADCFCFGTLAQRSDKSRQTLHTLLELFSSTFIFFDINLRKMCYSPQTIRHSLEKANALKMNDDEVRELSQLFSIKSDNMLQFCEFMIDEWNLDYCLITLGERGVFAHSASGNPIYIPGYKIKLADTVGAGDAFSAGFIHQLLAGKGTNQACSFGNLIGAIVATQHGATQPISAKIIAEFENKRHDRISDKKYDKYSIL